MRLVVKLEEVEKLVAKTKEVYKIDASRIFADYRAEQQYIADYNGRQILELLQNADDAKTDKIAIHIDRANNRLRISNNGIGFDLAGVESLMLANYSSKNKREFIGNKGLGFRSILNWVNKVSITTQNLILTFSPLIAKEQYTTLCKSNPTILELAKNDKTLSSGETPFAVLAIPSIKENKSSEKWETTITLEYKEEEEDNILQQIGAIQEEILLFLKHTQAIEISGTGNNDRQLNKTQSEKLTSINDRKWELYELGEQQFQNEQLYSYTIAWQNGLKDRNTCFFNYFPTNVKTHLPCLIHATFDLNTSRKELNDTQSNRFVLTQIVQALGKIATHQLQSNPSNWDGFRLLTQEESSDNILLQDFYKQIRNLRESLAIYPCIDGSYRTLENVFFLGNNFTSFLLENEYEEYFPNLLLDHDFDINIPYILDKEIFLKRIRILSSKIQDINKRADLICLLISKEFSFFHDNNYPLLINTNQEIISEKRTAFTPSKGDVKIPDFLELDEISKELYEALNERLKDEYDSTEPKARELQRQLKIICNIQPYDLSNLTKRIISGAKESISSTPLEGRVDIVQKMVSALYANRENSPEQEKISEEIPLVNRYGEIKMSKSLFLGQEYLSGEINEVLFDGVYNGSDYVQGKDFWGFTEKSRENIETFLCWLGVNKHTQLERIEQELNLYHEDDYVKYVFKNTVQPQHNSHKKYRVTSIKNLEKIINQPNFSIERLIAWIFLDKRVLNQISLDNDDSFSYTYNKNTTNVWQNPSYITFQIAKNISFANYLIEEETVFSKFFEQLDYGASVFREFNIPISEIKRILGLLGAIETIDDISIEQFYELFSFQEENFPEGKGSQAFYKRFLTVCLKKNTSENNDYKTYLNNLKCYARKGGKGKELRLKPVSEIYYFDNAVAPQNVLDDYWILNLPKRIGEQNVKRYFGVKPLQEELKELSIKEHNLSTINQELNQRINRLKPYFLCYRLEGLNKKTQENEEANFLKSLSIKLVTNCSYQFSDDVLIDLPDNAFIKVDDSYYLKSNSGSVEALRKNSIFCDAIAEILCIQFRVKEYKNSFRAIFKDDVSETEHLIKTDDLEDYLFRAKELLGISIEELTFWRNLYKERNQTLPQGIYDTKELHQKLLTDFEFKLPVNYEMIDFQNLSRKVSIDFLLEVRKIFSVELNKLITWQTAGFVDYYKEQLEQVKNDFKKSFDTLLWEKLTQDPEKQQQFIATQNRYTNICEQAVFREELSKQALNLVWDTEAFFKQKVLGLLKIDLTKKVADVEIRNQYQLLLQRNKIEETDIEDLSIRSLLYFRGNEKLIRNHIISLVERPDSPSSEIEEQHPQIGRLRYGNTKKINSITTSKREKTKTWSHSEKDTKRNKKAGKKAEKLTYYTLVQKYGKDNVRWVSGFSETSSDKSDAYHYDIEYKNEQGEWKYLEVKSFNRNYFFLTKEEKRFGQEQRGKYEIALVQGEEVFICSHIFSEDIEFEDNDFFSVVPSEYRVFLKITD